jgi:branched-chain amino acid transport system permease protein
VDDFAGLVVSGLSRGLLVGLVALGYVLIYRATGVVNFAVGSLMLLGIYLLARTHGTVGFLVAVLLALAAVGVVAAVLDTVVLRGSGVHDHNLLAVATIGINTAVTADVLRRIGSDVLPVGDPWQDSLVRVLGIAIPATRLAGLVIALTVLAGLTLLLRRTALGLAMRAAASEREGAALIGVNLGRVSTISWVLGGSVAVIGGAMLSMFPSAGVNAGSADIGLIAFAAAILGGLDSLPGAVLGAAMIGLAQELVAGYSDSLSFLGSGATTVLPFVLMILTLLVRPTGLLGSRRLERV